eukprot:7306075-Ditylum_brightwellii.AAC.1
MDRKNHHYNYLSKDLHWSDFVYASHLHDYEMWRDRGVVSKGIENIAEEGVTKDLVREINSKIKEESVLDQIIGAWIRKAIEGATSSPKEDLCVGTDGGYDYSFDNDPKNKNILPFKAGSTEDA